MKVSEWVLGNGAFPAATIIDLVSLTRTMATLGEKACEAPCPNLEGDGMDFLCTRAAEHDMPHVAHIDALDTEHPHRRFLFVGAVWSD